MRLGRAGSLAPSTIYVSNNGDMHHRGEKGIQKGDFYLCLDNAVTFLTKNISYNVFFPGPTARPTQKIQKTSPHTDVDDGHAT